MLGRDIGYPEAMSYSSVGTGKCRESISIRSRLFLPIHYTPIIKSFDATAYNLDTDSVVKQTTSERVRGATRTGRPPLHDRRAAGLGLMIRCLVLLDRVFLKSGAPSDEGSGLPFVIVLVNLLSIVNRWYIYNYD
jgi:hypothetical protein